MPHVCNEPALRRRALLGAALWMACLSNPARAEEPLAVPKEAKARIVVMTDIGGDPDDQQSLVRFLLYACDFEVEGLCTGFGWGHEKDTRPDLIRKAVDAYGQVLPNLRKHRADYPSHDELAALIKDGHNGDPHTVGPGMDSEASEWIVRVLKRDDPRPVWLSIWGGPRELAQALWKLARTHSSEELAAIQRKIRVHSIADQDRTAGWVKEHHPDVFWIYSNGLFRGIWKGGDQDLVSPGWLKRHVLAGHGPLGPCYPPKAAGKAGVKEGDTPSFFYVLPDGLSDPEHPEWGNWGGRFERSGRGREYVGARDLRHGKPDMLHTIDRWREAYQNAFQARMDWCVKEYGEANHEPSAVLNRDRSRAVLPIAAEPGGQVQLSAAGSKDPDGDTLAYHWWVYVEPGTYWQAAPIRGADAQDAVVALPRDAAGRTIHVILEVTDSGDPPLKAYRRAVVKVAGEPVPPPPGTPTAYQDLTTPVTRLEGPPEKTGPWQFYRGINVNGPAIKIDGQQWEGDAAEGFACQDRPLKNTQVVLRPPTDEAREKMIRSFRWDHKPTLSLTGLPEGTYAVFAYLWEETSPETYTIRLGGRVVEQDYDSGPAGRWRRLGPWIVSPQGGKITITASGGAANFSGIEVWRRVGKRE